MLLFFPLKNIFPIFSLIKINRLIRVPYLTGEGEQRKVVCCVLWSDTAFHGHREKHLIKTLTQAEREAHDTDVQWIHHSGFSRHDTP